MNIIPIFSSHHSISEAILTVEKEDSIDTKKPVSVLAIAKTHNLPAITVIDDDIGGFWKLYKNSKALGIQVVYGVKMVCCANLADHSEEGEKTESNIIVLFKNSQAYYDFVQIYSLASTDGFHKVRRIDWKSLQTMWTPNFELALPFYSSFIARNTLVFNQRAQPDFGQIKPIFFSQSHGLPFDGILESALQKYCAAEKYDVFPAHQVYYYLDADVRAHQTLKCINNRSTWQKPNLEHYSSGQFSFESYLKKIGKTICAK